MAKEVKDILLDVDTGELIIRNGDFVIGESSNQHIADLLLDAPGEWKQHPLVGIGIRKYINAPETPLEWAILEKRIRKQLDLDGFSTSQLRVNNFNDITIESILITEQ